MEQQKQTKIEIMNVAQFKLNQRFTLSFSDLGKFRSFEPMLIDNFTSDRSKQFIELSSITIDSVDELQEVIKEAKKQANKIIKAEILEFNEEKFIK